MFVLHESAHQLRGHLWVRQVAAWGVAAAAIQSLGQITLHEATTGALLSLGVTILAGLLAAIITQRLEFDADLAAVRAALSLGIPMLTATSDLSNAVQLASPGQKDQWSFCHPSPADRRALLETLSAPFAIQRAQDRSLLTVACALTAIALINVTFLFGV